MIARRQSDMLAYADNCLEPSRRAEFEALMAAEPEIRRQIEAWRSQNQAIRDAFASAGELPSPIRPKILANENARAEWMPQPVKSLRRPSGARPPPRLIAAKSGGSPALPHSGLPTFANRMRPGRNARRLLGALVLAAALLASLAGVNLTSPPEETIGAGVSAYRTYALGVASPVEYATADSGALARWLGSQIPRATPIPDLSELGLTLMGGRIVAGARAPAAFLLYQTRQHARVGLIAEPLDAPARKGLRVRRSGGVETVYWTGAGHGFALVGPFSEQRLTDLARLAADN